MTNFFSGKTQGHMPKAINYRDPGPITRQGAEMCYNLLEGEEVNWSSRAWISFSSSPASGPLHLLFPLLGTLFPTLFHSIPSSGILALTTQRKLNTTHLSWYTHHKWSQLLFACFPCYNASFMRGRTLVCILIHIFLANRQRIKDENNDTHSVWGCG